MREVFLLMLTTIKDGYMANIYFANPPYEIQRFYPSYEKALRECMAFEPLTTFRAWEILKYESVSSNILHK